MISINLNRIETLPTTVSEAYKQLRNNIFFSGDDIKCIAVTSCLPNEGKSDVSFQLCRTMAEAGNRVLYLDADIRNSVISARVAPDKKVNGLSHYLAGREDINNIICQTNIKNLYMIFAGMGVPNPSELLGNKRFEAMIASLKKLFDYIIIDCPPLGAVIDAAVIAQKADASIMVIESNKISYKMEQRVKEQLEKSGSKILGVVMNKVDTSSKGYYGKYYGKYYGQYYGKSADK